MYGAQVSEIAVSDVEIRWALQTAVPAEQRAAGACQRVSTSTLAVLVSAAVSICAHDLFTLARGMVGH